MTDRADLEQRLGQLEDKMEIMQLIAAYGPTADSGSGEVAVRMWVEDGWYDSGIERFDGAAAVGAMLDSLPLHRELMAGGCAHLTTVPLIELHGNAATATCHSQLLRRRDDHFEVWRTGAVQWQLVRTGEGWRIRSRENRLLDGTQPARDLFAAALPPVAAG